VDRKAEEVGLIGTGLIGAGWAAFLRPLFRQSDDPEQPPALLRVLLPEMAISRLDLPTRRSYHGFSNARSTEPRLTG